MQEIRQNTAHLAPGNKILSTDDIENWIRQTKRKPDTWGLIPATFVIDCEVYSIIADGHSEYIACAAGKSVLSAVEIFFQINKNALEIAKITNQSTGFCPEPKSWKQVVKALNLINIPYPTSFTIEFIFGRCEHCSQVNIVKESVFICSVCGSKLPQEWNFL